MRYCLDTSRKPSRFAGRFFYVCRTVARRVRRLGAPFVYHRHELSRRGEHCSPAQGKWTRINNICRLRGTARRGRTPGHLLLRRCRNSPCRALRRRLLFHSARLRGIINIDWKGGAAGARSRGRVTARTVEVQPKLWYNSLIRLL